MRGFSNSTKVKPKQLIKDICNNKKELNPSNIREYVDYKRKCYESIDRQFKLDKDSLFLKEEPKVKTKDFTNSLRISYGYWNLLIPTETKEDFTVSVSVGSENGFCQTRYNPNDIQGILSSNKIDLETQKKWKKEVMSQWKHSCKVLLDEAEKRFPGLKMYSVVCCEKSMKLLKQIKDDRLITIHPGVCFMFL